MCMEDTQYQIRVDNTVSKAFKVNTSLEQRYLLSSILFNITLEKLLEKGKGRQLECLSDKITYKYLNLQVF